MLETFYVQNLGNINYGHQDKMMEILSKYSIEVSQLQKITNNSMKYRRGRKHN